MMVQPGAGQVRAVKIATQHLEHSIDVIVVDVT